MSLTKSLCLLERLFILLLINFTQVCKESLPCCSLWQMPTMCFDKYLPCAWLWKDGFIININKHVLSTYCVPCSMWGASDVWDSSYLEGVLTEAHPRSRLQSCQGVILVTDMDHHPLAVNNDSRQSCFTGSHWSSSCICLSLLWKMLTLKNSIIWKGTNHNATYKSKSREALKPQVNNLVRDSRAHTEGAVKIQKDSMKMMIKKIKSHYPSICIF